MLVLSPTYLLNIIQNHKVCLFKLLKVVGENTNNGIKEKITK
jgi:hypothetical protein